MNIGVPRSLIVTMGALFSAYHVVLALYSIAIPRDSLPVFVAIGLYGIATIVSLLPQGPVRMPVWLASFNLAVACALPLLVTSVLDPQREGGNGYATWYVAAVGTLMTITSTRRRHGFAWVGVAFLAVQTIAWAGFGALGAIGVIGSISWVAVSHVLSSGMAKATRDAQRFSIAEREAADWQAAQEAHVSERQVRLKQTGAMAFDMLHTIVEKRGELSDEERRECLLLEGAIRDEIRGRKLLNDDVRREVMTARRRGSTVTLLDEGGLDDLDDEELQRVLGRLAEALHATDADKIIARTVPEGSDTAVTVVGLRGTGDGSASALGYDDTGEEILLWLEIPRLPER